MKLFQLCRLEQPANMWLFQDNAQLRQHVADQQSTIRHRARILSVCFLSVSAQTWMILPWSLAMFYLFGLPSILWQSRSKKTLSHEKIISGNVRRRSCARPDGDWRSKLDTPRLRLLAPLKLCLWEQRAESVFNMGPRTLNSPNATSSGLKSGEHSLVFGWTCVVFSNWFSSQQTLHLWHIANVSDPCQLHSRAAAAATSDCRHGPSLSRASVFFQQKWLQHWYTLICSWARIFAIWLLIPCLPSSKLALLSPVFLA